jgi:transcriptional regulator with XRE-family HTH domain
MRPVKERPRILTAKNVSDLAKASGTTAGYISRIENNRSGIELDTLQKLVEVGLRKKLKVSFD